MLAGVDFHNVIHADLEACFTESGVALQGVDMGLESITLVQGIWNFIEIKAQIDRRIVRTIVVDKTESILDKLVV